MFPGVRLSVNMISLAWYGDWRQGEVFILYQKQNNTHYSIF